MRKTGIIIRLIAFAFFGLMIVPQGNAQIAINDDSIDPDAQAMLDINSSNKGILIPRINIEDLDTEAPLTNPITTGMFVYNTNAITGEGFYYWDGSAWTNISATTNISGPQSIILEAEYPGAVLMADGSDNNGYMASDNNGSTANYMNDYNWESGKSTLQDYGIYVRVGIPNDFSSWQSNSIVVNYQTEDASSVECCVDMVVYEESNPTPLATVSQKASTSWATMVIPGTALSGLTAGETAVILITLYSRNGKTPRVGDIALQYFN